MNFVHVEDQYMKVIVIKMKKNLKISLKMKKSNDVLNVAF